MGFKVGNIRIHRVSVFSLVLGTLAVCAVLASVQSAQGGQQTATVRHIAVTGNDHDPGIEIRATGPIIPRTQTVTGPDRLIVDLPESRPAAGLKTIPINRGKLKDVRVGLLSANPPTTRVVLDLTAPTQYSVSPLANTIVVELEENPEPAAAPVASATDSSADTRQPETTSAVPTPPPPQPSESSRVRWIMPILVVTTIMAMLVIAVVAHLQNRRTGRGL